MKVTIHVYSTEGYLLLSSAAISRIWVSKIFTYIKQNYFFHSFAWMAALCHQHALKLNY